MEHTPQTIAEKLIEAAKKAGAGAADSIVVERSSSDVEVLNGALEQAQRSESTDLGLRVLIGQKQATVSTSNASDDTIRDMAERAVAMAKEAPDDPHAGLADPGQLIDPATIQDLDMIDTAGEPDPATLEAEALAAEAAARAVPGVTQMDTSGAGFGSTHVHLAGSNGFSRGYGRTESSLYAVAISGEGTGMERDYDGDHRCHSADRRNPEEIGKTAGTRAVERSGARKPATGTFPVLFDERISSSLVGHLLQAVNGSAISRGSSWLLDKLGEQVLPAGLDLIEEPHRPRITGSRPFDAEGLAKSERKIIADGILTGWTLDLATGRKLGMDSTGNAARGTAGPPAPNVGNITLSPGTSSRDDLLKDMGTGLLITSMIGSTINPNTGDYSRGASGFWVENGEITYPVNECTVAGNLIDMLARIVPANDARPWLSRRVPSILIDDLSLAGE